jgi:DNA repair protein RadC
MGLHDGHRQKMRQRFLNGGLDSFADHEVLELLLFYAIPRRDTNATAHRLLERYGSLACVFSAPFEDLKKADGIGESAAVLLKLVPQAVQRARLSGNGRDIVLNSTEKAGQYLMDRLAGERNEVVYQLCLDRKGKLLACKRLSEGGADSADLNIRRLVENALLTSASAVILAHNHPSGIALPSRGDYETTERVQTALKSIGVPLVDHIIVADGDFVSLADSGILKNHT